MKSEYTRQRDEEIEEKLEDLAEHPSATSAEWAEQVKGGLLPAVRLPRFHYSASHDSM